MKHDFCGGDYFCLGCGRAMENVVRAGGLECDGRTLHDSRLRTKRIKHERLMQPVNALIEKVVYGSR